MLVGLANKVTDFFFSFFKFKNSVLTFNILTFSIFSRCVNKTILLFGFVCANRVDLYGDDESEDHCQPTVC